MFTVEQLVDAVWIKRSSHSAQGDAERMVAMLIEREGIAVEELRIV